MKTYLTVFLLAFFSGCIFLNVLKRYSFKESIFRHKNNVSFLGGVGLLASFSLGVSIPFFYKRVHMPPELIHILIFSFIVFITAAFDDLKELSLSKKILVQVIIICLFLVKGKLIQVYFIPLWGNYLISFLWLLGVTNMFNLLDIGDGLCVGVSLIAGLAFFIVLAISGNFITAGLFAGLCGALLSCLIFNFPPAKIILGNSGSHFLGFLFATLSIHGDYATMANPYSVLIPLIILAFPMIDTLYLISIRFKKGLAPLRKSKDHIFLQLLVAKNKKRQALFNIYLVTFLWGVSGVLLFFKINIFFLGCFTLAIISSARLIFSVQHNN